MNEPGRRIGSANHWKRVCDAKAKRDHCKTHEANAKVKGSRSVPCPGIGHVLSPPEKTYAESSLRANWVNAIHARAFFPLAICSFPEVDAVLDPGLEGREHLRPAHAVAVARRPPLLAIAPACLLDLHFREALLDFGE